MTDTVTTLGGPDLAAGVSLSTIPDGGMLPGYAHGDPVVLARRGHELFAFDAFCPHYGAPLADGLLVDDTVRCPWHHACFSLRTGEALRAPAVDAVASWRVEQRDDVVYVAEKLGRALPQPPSATAAAMPNAIVIVGGGKRHGRRGLHWMRRVRRCVSEHVGFAFHRGEDHPSRVSASGAGGAVPACAGDGRPNGRRGFRRLHLVRRVPGGVPQGNQHRHDRAHESRLPERDGEACIDRRGSIPTSLIS